MDITGLINQGEIDIVTDYCDSNGHNLPLFNTIPHWHRFIRRYGWIVLLSYSGFGNDFPMSILSKGLYSNNRDPFSGTDSVTYATSMSGVLGDFSSKDGEHV